VGKRGGFAFRTLEEITDLAVGRLGEVLVPFANGSESGRHLQANDFVGVIGEALAGARRADWNRDENPRCAETAQGAHSGSHGRARRKAIVDKDHGTSAKVERRPCAPIQTLTARDLAALPRCGVFQHPVRYSETANDFLVFHHHVSADRAHRELLVSGHSELADDEYVEGKLEFTGNFVTNRDSAARQGQYDRIPLPGMLAKRPGKLLSGGAPVGKQNWHANRRARVSPSSPLIRARGRMAAHMACDVLCE
jgi:hypothetical protein